MGSIRHWVCKVGHYRIHNYVVWVDESVRVGEERLLLVVGCPLALGCGGQWKGWESLPAGIAEHYAFLHAHRPLIETLSDIGQWIDRLFGKLKNRGFPDADLL